MTLSAQSQPTDPSSDKAKAILVGAFQVFATHGYAAASMDRIASTAGVSKPTLYRYFQDKEGLFVALIQNFTQDNRSLIFELNSNTEEQTPPDQALRKMATALLRKFTKNHPLLTLMRLVIGESERFPELARTFIQEVQKPSLAEMTQYLASQPQLQLSDPEVAARIFSGALVHYLITQRVLHGEDIIPLESDRMIEGLIQLITPVDQPS